MAARSAFQWFLAGLAMLLAAAEPAMAEAPFKPHLVGPADDPICKIALDHYTRLFRSTAQESTNRLEHRGIRYAAFEYRQIVGQDDGVYVAEVRFGKSPRLFVYFETMLRSAFYYAGYLVEPSELDELARRLEADNFTRFRQFYPVGRQPHYDSNMSLDKIKPFAFRGNWYVLGDSGYFLQSNGVRQVHRVGADGHAKLVCTVKVLETFDAAGTLDRLPFFSAYVRIVEPIMWGSGQSGWRHGTLGTAMAFQRPWAVEPGWAYRPDNELPGPSERDKKHFAEWQYEDIWSNREYQVLGNAWHDAVDDLTDYYAERFAMSRGNARKTADLIVSSLPYQYYQLGVYYDQGKDFSFLRTVLETDDYDFAEFKNDRKLKYGVMPLSHLSLVVDHPRTLQRLPPDIPAQDIRTHYGKDLLMFAAHMNNYDSVRHLLDAGWSAEVTTNHGSRGAWENPMERWNRSALVYAAENASIELIELLVNAGADTEIRDSQGNDLDHYVRRNPRFSAADKALGFAGLLARHTPTAAVTPGFTCRPDLDRIARAICDSKGLSIYDRELNDAYSTLAKRPDLGARLKASQRKWLRRRDLDCGSFEDADLLSACIARTTRARIRYLQYLGGAPARG